MKSWVKLEDVFLIRRGEKKICAGEFDFCRGEFAMTTVHPFSFFHREKLNKSENSCHSLHGCCNRLNINTLPCNVLVFRMSLMSLGWKVTSVTWHFCLSLHGELLKINELQWLCNEWHEFSNVESVLTKFRGNIHCYFQWKSPLVSFRRPKGGRISCTSTLCSRDSSLTLWMTNVLVIFLPLNLVRTRWIKTYSLESDSFEFFFTLSSPFPNQCSIHIAVPG